MGAVALPVDVIAANGKQQRYVVRASINEREMVRSSSHMLQHEHHHCQKSVPLPSPAAVVDTRTSTCFDL